MSARCSDCGGPFTIDYEGDVSCLHCGRSPRPPRVSLYEALLSNASPSDGDGDNHGLTGYGPRQRVPIEMSLARAAAWGRGERAE